MYITITHQKLGINYSPSAAGFADGKDRKVNFATPNWRKEIPIPKHEFSAEDLELSFQKMYREAKAIYKSKNFQK